MATFDPRNKITLQELDIWLQGQIGLIDGMSGDVGAMYPGATKVENLGDGKIKINDVEKTVYAHPGTHPVTMIVGLATVATSAKYTDLTGCPTELPASDVYDWAKALTKPSYTAAEVKAIPASMKGTSNGVAELDNLCKLPIEQLPDSLFDLANTGEMPMGQIPVLDITEKLKDNGSKVLIVGGMGPLNMPIITKAQMDAAALPSA